LAPGEWPVELFVVDVVEVFEQDLGRAEAPQSGQLVAPVVGLAALGTFVNAIFTLEPIQSSFTYL
jgi:hypothetical protein